MNFSSHCAPRIKEERLRLGLSQVQVAEKSGVSREMWGRYERGDAIPGGEVLFSFAIAGADIQYVLTGIRSAGESGVLEARVLSIVKKFDNLDEFDKVCFERLLLGLSAIGQNR